MPIKFRNKTKINSNNISENKKKFSNITSQFRQTPDFQDFGLKGSNVQINFKIGSNRASDALLTGKPGTISGCKSEDCLHASVYREKLTTRKILTDRPATAVISKRNPYSSLRRKVTNSTSRDDYSVNPSSDWIPPAPVSFQSWSSSVDSELATVGSFDSGTEASLEDKQSFAVFSSVSFDSPEHLVPDPTLQNINDPLLTQDSTSRNFAEPIQSIISSRQLSHFHSDLKSARCELYNSGDERSDKKDDRATYQAEPQKINMESPSKNRPTSSYIAKLSTEQKASLNPESETNLSNQSSFEVEACANSNGSVSESGNLSNLTNDSVDEIDGIIGICTSSRKSEKPSDYQRFCEVKQKKESPMNNEEIKKDQVTKKEPNVLSEILNFLDDANSHTPLASSPHAINSETESNAEGRIRKKCCEDVTRLNGMSVTELREEILALQMMVQDKDNKLVVLERALQHQRELLARNVKTTKRELNLRCKAQKEEYESNTNRNFQFIQQLVEEKKTLAKKCEALATEMRQQTVKAEYERRVSDERHNAEIRRLKQNLGKDQRCHQEKWLADRTEHIREATARGLEPELRRLMGQHQVELQSLRSIHQEELNRIEQAHLNKTLQQLNALREKMDNDREDACAKEREIMRVKYDKQLDEMEAIHTSKLQRLQVDMERERARWLEEESRTKLQEDEKIRRLEENRRREKIAAQQLLQAEIATLKQQNVEQVAQLKKKWEEEKEEEIRALKHHLEMNSNDRERQLLENHRREREDEEKNFSSRLSDELKRQHEQWKNLSENQFQRMRDKNTEEIKRLDQAESELRHKLMEVRRSLAERDEELAALRLTLFQHVKENKDIKKTMEKFSVERSDLKKVLQKELEDEFLKINEEKRELQRELNQAKSEHRLEINKKNSEISHLSACHEQMLGDIHEKVKQAVAKKDDALAQIQEKFKIAICRCQHLEELLDRQQRDLFERKN